MHISPYESPHPAFTFAFVIEDTFALSWGGVTVVSAPGCKWPIPSLTMKAILRTPDGNILESAASLLHTTSIADGIISLNLADLTKADVPIGTELFVRMRRTPEEQHEALAALDHMMGACWTHIEEFPELPDAQDFQLWIKQKIAKGLAEEVTIKKPHRQNKSGEHWYKNTETNKVWRYLETILPNRESFECIENYSQIDQLHITVDPSCSPHSPNLPIKVWINDRLALEDDYTLDIESFFVSLDRAHGTITFTGGCGIPECCAMGLRTKSDDKTWHWGDFEFTWDNVYDIATQLISLVESLPRETGNSFCEPLLKEFRRKRDGIKNRLGH